MATYKKIFGKQVKFLSSDPTNESEGQIWYNSTSGAFKSTLVTQAWSSSSPMSQARYGLAGAGTQTAALATAGSTTGSDAVTNNEGYNGSGWSTETVLPVGRIYIGGCGTQTAALVAGGGSIPTYASINSYEYDGSTWTAGGDMAQITGTFGQLVGLQTAGLVIGGDQVPATPRSIANVEEYNGASWTAVTAVPSVRNNTGNFGIQTAAIAAGGEAQTPPGVAYLTETLEYNGSSWTTGGALPAVRYRAVGCGTQTDGIMWGGVSPPPTSSITTTLDYDGSAWTANPASLATAKQQAGTSTGGTSSAAVTFAGSAPGVTADTQEYNKSTSVITAGAWAAGGNMLDGIQVQAGGFGLQTAAVQVGGQINPAPPYMTNATGNYDGSSWTASGVYPEARGGIGTTGTQTAGVAFGGTPDFASFVTAANEYDGSTWTAATAYPVAYRLVCGVGPQTAALAATGDAWPTAPRYSSLCNDYDGTSWTAAAANTGSARYSAMAAGTATAAAICGGTNPGSGTTEEFNGASWTVGGANLASKSAGGATKSGTSDDWLLFGTNNALCTGYDGTAWSTRPNLGTARYDTGGAGTASAGLAFGGGPNSSQTNSTEEFTPEASAANIVTVTTS